MTTDAKALDVLKMFVERITANGEWDDGCFYYRRTSASELQEPILLARDLLAQPRPEQVEDGAVAWRWRYEGERAWSLKKTTPDEWPDVEMQPLYARPAPKPAWDVVETFRRALQNAQNALRSIEKARVSYGATGFPMGLHPDPAKWMEDFAERAADEIDAVLSASPTPANAAPGPIAPADLNRRVDVENVLLSVAAGKRAALTPDECRDLAYRLGVPEEYRKP
jgi:hypothetical protein